MYADITIKAHCPDPAVVESILLQQGASYTGLDVQTDNYYETDFGKLKHRQGTIENVLIHYNRTWHIDAFKTEVLLYLKNPGAATVNQICQGKKVLYELKKTRKIFFIDNVKFHLDQVEDLGNFVEIEAIDLDGSVGLDVIRQQCDYYKDLLRIQDEDVVTHGYIDMINRL